MAGAVTALMLLAGCGSSQRGSESLAPPRSTPKTTPAEQLIELRDIAQLRSLFNSRSAEPRLILLVSPT
jgi:hypothetical protein